MKTLRSMCFWPTMLLVCGSAFAQAAEPKRATAYVLSVGTFPDAAACEYSQAMPVTFTDLLQRQQAYRGACISFVAYFDADNSTVATDRQALNYQWSAEAGNLRRAGFDLPDNIWKRMSRSDTTRARLVGRLLDCNDLKQPGVNWISGYCHEGQGPIVVLSEFHPIR